MNYAHKALEALRFACIDEYRALGDDERAELAALLAEWRRITAAQNARLEALAEDAEAEAERRAVRAKLQAHQATLDDLYGGLGAFARRELSAYLAEDPDFDTPLETWLNQLAASDRAAVAALVSTI
ncbi:hypothetical protein [Thiocystis violacea]|uniref:hypothetical protein n=1 Tax=Thiocystis violacea TaxID=13725 RepID=UPI0019042D49|nr:hypothetical protein [Thiocystis violacea]MBK1722814.1 hypothetical protein [Thiocystis violacea]